MINDLKFQSDKPYPEIVASCPNEYIVKMLSNLYSGRNSELSAILQYAFQHSVLKQNNDEIAYILERISIVEMHHLELLANAIVAFGGLPCYEDGNGQTFCADGVCYYTNLACILEKSLQDERDAVNAYIRTANCVQNVSLRALLLRLAEDEQIHADILNSLLCDLQSFE